MKTLKITLTITLTFFVSLLITSTTNAQIQFEGLYSEGEGIAGWNADGTGPEPAATGHVNPLSGDNHLYYGASRDYITQNTDHAGFRLLSGMSGFAGFEQALADNGFTPEQVKVKFGLSSLMDDIEGIDWFVIGNNHMANYYSVEILFELDGELMLSGHFNYLNIDRESSNLYWYIHSSFSPIEDVSSGSSSPVQDVAEAFMIDLDRREIKITYENTVEEVLGGNGREGYYFNVLNGQLEVGYPEIPFKGLNANHEGFAGWDADGSGPEPYGNGHNTQLYYGASLDYDGIDPDPNACLGHFLDGSSGFFNTLLQLEYRGFEIGNLKLKYGLTSLGPDVEGEDWGNNWCNYYNNTFIIELNGEPILTVLEDTSKLESMTSYWMSGASIGKVYDISENASSDAQFVAQSFIKDMGSHFLKTNTYEVHIVSLFSDNNGRDGAKYEITEGAIVGVHENATFIPEGTVSGTWTAENSPYYVDGHVTVENDLTLTIESGVKVAIRGPYHFDVQGCVIAEGIADENIVFTRSNPNIMWDGFDYIAITATNDTSFFDFCLFEYAYAQGAAPANSGGAFGILNLSNIKITNSIFQYNKADIESPPWTPSGGAIAVENGGNVFIQKCIFRNNYAIDGGAIIIYSGTNPIISNCLFYENEANSDAGAIEFNSNCGGILINNTFADNQANNGGAVQVKSGSSPIFINTIFWGNEATVSGNQIRIEDAASEPEFYYCDIEEGQAGFGGINFTGDYLFNLEGDPNFETSTEFPYMLSAGSPCINMGTPDTSAWFYDQYLPETCLCGNERTLNGNIEIGAYERLITGVNNHEFNQSNLAISIHPNPFRNSAQITYELSNDANVKIEIYNYLGQKVDEPLHTFQSSGKYNFSFNAANLQTGTYVSRITVDQQVYINKFIKY